MIVYRTFSTSDMAGSDAYHPTMKDVRTYLKNAYGITGPVALDGDGECEWEVEGQGVVHLERLNVTPTRRGICDALTYYPCR